MNTPLNARWIVAVAAFAIGCSLTPRANAQENRNASLNWVRAAEADGCTSARGVAQRVESYFRSENLLEEESFTFVPSGSGHIAIEGYVSRFRDGFQVVIGVSHDDSKLDGVEFVEFEPVPPGAAWHSAPRWRWWCR